MNALAKHATYGDPETAETLRPSPSPIPQADGMAETETVTKTVSLWAALGHSEERECRSR